MKHIAAYLLLQMGGNPSPTVDDVKRVLGAVGIEADDERLASLIAQLKDKDIQQLIAEGSAKLAVPVTGAVNAQPQEKVEVRNAERDDVDDAVSVKTGDNDSDVEDETLFGLFDD